jgi:Ca2+-binding RTX toxin-like protein
VGVDDGKTSPADGKDGHDSQQQGSSSNNCAENSVKTNVIDGTSKVDTLHGTSSNDIIHGGAGNDTIYASNGNDHLYGDAGNDLFMLGDVHGHTTIDGGTGNWTDVIEVTVGGGPAAALSGHSWTLEIDNHQVVNTHQQGSVDAHDQSGTIHTEHGDISFDHIDKIQW